MDKTDHISKSGVCEDCRRTAELVLIHNKDQSQWPVDWLCINCRQNKEYVTKYQAELWGLAVPAEVKGVTKDREFRRCEKCLVITHVTLMESCMFDGPVRFSKEMWLCENCGGCGKNVAPIFQPIEEKPKQETYKAYVICENCESGYDIDVPKGLQVRQYLEQEGIRCKSCDCLTLEKGTKKYSWHEENCGGQFGLLHCNEVEKVFQEKDIYNK